MHWTPRSFAALTLSTALSFQASAQTTSFVVLWDEVIRISASDRTAKVADRATDDDAMTCDAGSRGVTVILDQDQPIDVSYTPSGGPAKARERHRRLLSDEGISANFIKPPAHHDIRPVTLTGEMTGCLSDHGFDLQDGALRIVGDLDDIRLNLDESFESLIKDHTANIRVSYRKDLILHSDEDAPTMFFQDGWREASLTHGAQFGQIVIATGPIPWDFDTAVESDPSLAAYLSLDLSFSLVQDTTNHK